MKCPSCQAENLSDSQFCHKCAAPLPKDLPKPKGKAGASQTSHLEPKRGDVFAGRYEILEDLGQGGLGKVYKAFDQKAKKTVALKLIGPEIRTDEKALERFRNELKIARKISPGNVCRMYDLGKEGSSHYITAEYVEGEDLKRLIRMAGRLTPPKSISIVTQVCEGLSKAHSLGLVHRDLKPQNIMIDREGNAWIMDFGIACLHEAEGVGGSGAMIGTPEYMSPEQAELKETDKRSDLYSLGVILYEMLSGCVPFEGETPLSVAMKHKGEKPRDIRELRPLISPAAAALISKCLEKDPGKRYQTAEELISDLKRIEKEAPAAEKEPCPPKEAAPKKPSAAPFKARKLVIPAVAVLVIAAAICVWQLVLVPGGEPETSSESVQAPEDSLITEIEPTKLEPAPVKKRPAGDKKKAALTPKTESSTQKQEESKDEEQPAKKTQALVKPRKPALTEAETRSLDLSKARLNAAKIQAQNKGLDAGNLLFRLAGEKELAAETAATVNDFSKAKSLLKTVESMYRLSLKCKTDQDCAKALQDTADDLRKKAGKSPAASVDSDLNASAARFNDEGMNLLQQKEYENASRLFVEAILLYEQISAKS